MSRATIKSIAKDLGISHMTVSRALSNSPKVQKETRDAVLERAHELGYVKSAAALMMRGDAPRILGLLLPNIVNEFYARFANDMALACDRHALHLIIHLTNDDALTQQQSLDRLQEVQATSVVMVPAPESGDRAPPMTGSMNVIELIRQSEHRERRPAVLVEDGPAIQAAVRHLAETGHRSIAYIGASSALSSGRARLDAFRAGASAAGLNVSEDLIQTCVPSFAMGRAQAEAILKAGCATALLCGGFELSNGALSALIEAREDPKTDLAFIGYGDPSFYAWVNEGVSTIRVPVTELALHAVELAAAPDRTGARQTSFPAELILR